MIAAAFPHPTCVVVGSGRLGRALAAALSGAGFPCRLLGGRTSADRPADVFAALGDAGPGALLLLAVRDDALPELVRRLAEGPPPPAWATVLHLSGALELDVLAPLERAGFGAGSCHPLQTFTGSEGDARRFAGATFAVDGSGPGQEAARSIALALGGSVLELPGGGRTLYHLAASLGANGLTALVAAARDALAAAGGLTAERALEALAPLLRSALGEALSRGPEASLTGPTARGDDSTLAIHRRALGAWDASRLALFEALVREQRRLAARSRAGTGC